MTSQGIPVCSATARSENRDWKGGDRKIDLILTAEDAKTCKEHHLRTINNSIVTDVNLVTHSSSVHEEQG